MRFCRIFAVGLILLLVVAACGASATATPITQPVLPTATVEQTTAPVAMDTPVPTETQAPADTPAPTLAPSPTDTPAPADTPAPTVAPSPTDTPAPTDTPFAAMVETSLADNLGAHLVDGDGMTLYLFTNDQPNVSTCSGGCAGAWPPLATVADPSAGEGVTATILGTVTRDDGTVQVTYNGWPLYGFSGDAAPGDANGQDSRGVWFTVSTNGGPIQSNAAVNTAEHPDLGTILVEASGRTLYLLTSDEPSVSTCSGGCARAWPPLVTVGDPVAGESVDGELLETITREDGSVQVTYNGWPVHYYARDGEPGDANGQGAGGVWFAVSNSGEPIVTDDSIPSY